MDFREAVETYALIMNLKESVLAKCEALGTTLTELETESKKPMHHVTETQLEATQMDFAESLEDLTLIKHLRQVAMGDIAAHLEERVAVNVCDAEGDELDQVGWHKENDANKAENANG